MADNDFPINYETVLADLKAKRDKLDAAISGIETMLGITSTAQAGGQQASAEKANHTVESDTFFRMSIPDAARKYLNMMKKPQTTQQIADALERGGMLHSSKDFTNGVGSILTRLDKAGGDIVKTGRATFGLAAWYPGGKPRKNGSAKKNDQPVGAEESSGSDDAEYAGVIDLA